jgi:hypothetical protein
MIRSDNVLPDAIGHESPEIVNHCRMRTRIIKHDYGSMLLEKNEITQTPHHRGKTLYLKTVNPSLSRNEFVFTKNWPERSMHSAGRDTLVVMNRSIHTLV